jgi:hypothetical protein
MKTFAASILFCLLAVGWHAAADARDRKVRAQFQKTYPCPSTGKKSGACPGYVGDHIIPLCLGGPDVVPNMQWQDRRSALLKDKKEKADCARRKR